MKTVSRRFLVLVFAGTLCSRWGLRGTRWKSVATATEEQPEEYKNWTELAMGGVITSGDRAQFEQEHRLPGDQVYGGIQDLHLEGTIGKNVQFSLDGHALWDFNDYDITMQLAKPNFGYIKAGYQEFRSWYDGNAAFFPHNDVFFNPPYPEMHVDRGDAWIELGLRAPDWPEITIRYDHEFRFGQKDSTVWGDTNLTGLRPPTIRREKSFPLSAISTRSADIFSLRGIEIPSAIPMFCSGCGDEHNTNDYSLNLVRGAGQLPPVVPPPGQQRKVTQRQNDDVDLFSGHGITVTRLTDNLWFTDWLFVHHPNE